MPPSRSVRPGETRQGGSENRLGDGDLREPLCRGQYTTGGKSIIFGDLRDRGASFVGWYPCDAREEFLRSEIAKLSKERVPEGVAQADFVEAWEDPTPWSKDLARHGYRYERHDSNHDPLRLAAEAMAHDPLYKSTINVSLRRQEGFTPLSRHRASGVQS